MGTGTGKAQLEQEPRHTANATRLCPRSAKELTTLFTYELQAWGGAYKQLRNWGGNTHINNKTLLDHNWVLGQGLGSERDYKGVRTELLNKEQSN